MGWVVSRDQARETSDEKMTRFDPHRTPRACAATFSAR
jgi:hypothetical protein